MPANVYSNNLMKRNQRGALDRELEERRSAYRVLVRKPEGR